MSNDISISPVGLNNKVLTFNKPSYLVIFEDYAATKKGNVKKIVTLDKPDCSGNFIQAKGIFSEASEEEVVSSYQNLLTEAKKEDIVEVMIPWNRIFSVRSLVFKAK